MINISFIHNFKILIINYNVDYVWIANTYLIIIVLTNEKMLYNPKIINFLLNKFLQLKTSVGILKHINS